MYLISIKGREEEGAYAVSDSDGEKALYFFEDEDDAQRYAWLLEADDYPEMVVVEVDDDVVVETCEMYGYRYAIISCNEFVIPPRNYDNVQENKMA